MELINRQDVIDIIMGDGLYCDTYADKVYSAERIKNIPTVEPKKGKWEIDVDHEYDIFDIEGERTWATKATCSECGFAMRFIEEHGVFKYCPNCGARMGE